ncbi:hypothetical protein H0H92_016160 [Tricholoma furcatifolium]|nr:hypothetical protein H0H92_016160 [Tricholoma furcatifolium]
MRLASPLAVLFILYMFACIYCKTSYDDQKRLRTHQPRCSKKKNLVISAGGQLGKKAERGTQLGPPSNSSNKSFVQEPVVRASPGPIAEDEPPMNLPPAEEVEPLPAKRVRRPPRRLVDYLPSNPRILVQLPLITSDIDDSHRDKRQHLDDESETVLPVPETPPTPPEPVETEPNEMGLFRRYQVPPTRDPDEDLTIHHVADAPTFIRDPETDRVQDPLNVFGPTAHKIAENSMSSARLFYPFLNISVFRLMSWFYSSKKLTLAALDRLVYSVILAPGFKQERFDDFSAIKENKRLDDNHTSENDHLPSQSSSLPSWLSRDKWRKGSVEIPLPFKGERYRSEEDAAKLEVQFYHRDLVEAFTSGVQDFAAKKFHWRGFKEYWKPSPHEPEQRVYGEVYTSDAFAELEESITPVDGCPLETAVVPLMLYSDSTRLAQFGSFSAHHLAYLPCLPDTAKDKYLALFGVPPTSATLTFLRRELIQAIWKHLLTDDFKKIYREGLVVQCGDGIKRRLYPRFFVYSADYKERVLVIGIKDIGTWLCATCRIMISQVLRLGTKLHDFVWSSHLQTDSVEQQNRIRKARKKIFSKGNVVNGKAIDDILGESLVPVENTFSLFLLPEGHNYFDLFARDLMHEFELGVWKSLFTHLIRMLYTFGLDSVAALDRRYRQVSPFGRSTIRRFRNDVSSMKSLAARDFEDLVQTAVQDLLFVTACWHASAKMRIHTDWSLNIFRGITKSFTQHIRLFCHQVCPQFATHETPKEADAAARRCAAEIAKKVAKPSDNNGLHPPPTPARKDKTFNINTPKMHSIVHYPASIQRFGTTDSYSTQTGEQEHICVKAFYARTNKNQFENQIAQQERRVARSRAIEHAASHEVVEEEELPQSKPDEHHYISQTKHTPLNLLKWTKENEADPAVYNFATKLVEHLLRRLVPQPDMQENHRGLQVIIRDNIIYEHKTLRINYTTYDNRREQDTINPNRHSDVMFLANEEDPEAHPYWYFRIIKIFHALVRLNRPGQQFQRVEFLWGRWYGLDHQVQSGFSAKRMHQIGFLEGNEAFEFANPSDVIHAVHLIPRFAGPRIDYLLGPSLARWKDEEDLDYERYYINPFVDRDMFVRFCGNGIGHYATRKSTQTLVRDTERGFAGFIPQLGDGSDDDDDDPVEDEDSDEGSGLLDERDSDWDDNDGLFDESLGFADL